MTALDAVYQERILAFAADIPRQGRLADADASATVVSRACGSTVTVYLKLADGRIADFAHEVDACALGSAAASIVARAIVGRTGPEVTAARDQLKAMLRGEGPPPGGAFADLGVLEPARDLKNRHQSILLALEASVRALKTLGRA